MNKNTIPFHPIDICPRPASWIRIKSPNTNSPVQVALLPAVFVGDVEFKLRSKPTFKKRHVGEDCVIENHILVLFFEQSLVVCVTKKKVSSMCSRPRCFPSLRGAKEYQRLGTSLSRSENNTPWGVTGGHTFSPCVIVSW